MKAKILLTIAILLVIVTFYILIEPTIKPDEIILEATLYNLEDISKSELLPNTDCDYVLEIIINKNTQKPLIDKDRRYRYEVYPIVSGNAVPYIHTLNLENLSVGATGEFEILAINRLKEIGIISEANQDYFSKQHINGFIYLEEEYPVRVQCYIKGNEIKKGNNVVLFTFLEKKFGKNMSWVKITPLELRI